MIFQDARYALNRLALYNYANVDAHCSDPIRFIGYPSLDGTGARADTAFSMAITRSSQYKDEAWSFIRSFFEDDVQLAIVVGSFPVNRKAFDDLIFFFNVLSRQTQDDIIARTEQSL